LSLLAAFVGAMVSMPPQTPRLPLPAVERVKGVSIRWSTIPTGTFQMGCVPGDDECEAEEQPRHAVTLTYDFALMTTEVTVEMFRAYSSEGHSMPLQPNWSAVATQPMVLVTHFEAADFCAWLGGRLPTEAEWERAARGGVEGLKYPWGDERLGTGARRLANVPDESLGRKSPSGAYRFWGTYDDGFAYGAPVGSFPPNQFGLYDMIGNVLEHVSDISSAYPVVLVVDPRGGLSGKDAVARGGSWNRTDYRISERVIAASRSASSWDVGFRCARDVKK